MKQENLDNDYLVDYLISKDVLKSENLIKAFRKIDRKDFVLIEEQNVCYLDSVLHIGYGQTMTQPLVVAHMLELLDLKDTNRVLDIGSGSAYTTALISQSVGRTGYVFGLEKIPTLVSFGQKNLKKYDIYNAFISKASFELGITNKKFDRILVSATSQYLPVELLEQLEEDGKLVIPINNSIYLIEKKDGQFIDKEFNGFEFMPLVVD